MVRYMTWLDARPKNHCRGNWIMVGTTSLVPLGIAKLEAFTQNMINLKHCWKKKFVCRKCSDNFYPGSNPLSCVFDNLFSNRHG